MFIGPGPGFKYNHRRIINLLYLNCKKDKYNQKYSVLIMLNGDEFLFFLMMLKVLTSQLNSST